MSRQVVDNYIEAIVRGDVDAVLETLDRDFVFHSPFNVWRAKHARAIFTARARAFSGLIVDAVVRENDRAVLLWRATIDERSVDSSEALSIRNGKVIRADAYLRPAIALDLVHQAMSKAWPVAVRQHDQVETR
jgi:ketosteroid isomerase-like protein